MRAPGIALGHQHLGHAVVQAGHDRERLERLLVHTLGLGILATLVHQGAQRGVHPRLRAAGQDGLEELFQFLEAVEVTQGIGPITQAQRCQARVFLAQLGTGGQHFGRAIAVQRLQNRL
ncbi:hypothetical protein D3C79_913130 [compost metagenome]